MPGNPSRRGESRAQPAAARVRLGLVGLGLVGVLGSVDVAQFLVGNPSMFVHSPGRTLGSVLGLVLWLVLLGVALWAIFSSRRGLLLSASVWLAGLLTIGSLLLVVVHAAARVGGLRPAAGALLALLALVASLLVRRADSRAPAPRPALD